MKKAFISSAVAALFGNRSHHCADHHRVHPMNRKQGFRRSRTSRSVHHFDKISGCLLALPNATGNNPVMVTAFERRMGETTREWSKFFLDMGGRNVRCGHSFKPRGILDTNLIKLNSATLHRQMPHGL